MASHHWSKYIDCTARQSIAFTDCITIIIVVFFLHFELYILIGLDD